VDGLNPSMRYIAPMARARGEAYLNPLDERDPTADQGFQLAQSAVVIGGAVVTEPRRIELVLNQRSVSMARAVANRINTRFPKAPTDREQVAEARNDTFIKINVPRSYIGREDELMALVNHTYVQTGPGFVQSKAQALGEVLANEITRIPTPDKRTEAANQIALAWHALGKTALRQVRAYYGHENMLVRLTAIEAGARLGDGQTITHIQALALHPEPAVRVRVPWIAVRLPRSPAMTHTLRSLLDDNDQRVRIVTYEALADAGDGMVNRIPVGGIDGQKFVIELVPSSKPLVYVSQKGASRLVVFSPNAGFKRPMYASVWNGRLRLRSADTGDRIAVYYQRPTGASKTFAMAPTVANLALLLSQPASIQNPNEAPNLTYGDVVNAIHSLHELGWLSADLLIEQNRLAEAVQKALNAPPVHVRPESAGVARGYGALTDPNAAADETLTSSAADGNTTISAPPTFVRDDGRAATAGPTRAASGPRVLAPSIADEAARQQEVPQDQLPPAQETYLTPADEPETTGDAAPIEGPRAGR
jgi:hypothetical protein